MMDRQQLIEMLNFHYSFEVYYASTVLETCGGFTFLNWQINIPLLIFIDPRHDYTRDIIDQRWEGSVGLNQNINISDKENGVIYTRDSAEFAMLSELIYTMTDVICL